jgi:hypothetical protein
MKRIRIEWRLPSLLAGILTVTILAVTLACGGDDEKTDEGGNEPTATRESGDRDGESTPDSGDGDGDDAAADLSALAAEYGDFTGVVKYETSGFEGDSFTSMMIYKDGSRSRVDYDGADGSGSFITNEDGTFACAENQCIKFAEGQGLDPTAAFTAFISAETVREAYGDVPEGVNVEKTSEEIAGIDATCYNYSGDIDESEAGDESGEICFAESGVLLRLEFSGASGGGKFEAVEAKEGVSDSDFEPPFDVIDFGEFGQ